MNKRIRKKRTKERTVWITSVSGPVTITFPPADMAVVRSLALKAGQEERWPEIMMNGASQMALRRENAR